MNKLRILLLALAYACFWALFVLFPYPSHAAEAPGHRCDGAFGPQHGLHGVEVHIAAEVARLVEVDSHVE